MSPLPTLILARDRIQHGLTPKELVRRMKAGSLVRVRQGVYVDGPTWRGLRPWEQYRLRVQAAAETFESPTVFARHSAASVGGIPTIGQGHPVVAPALRNDGGRSRAGVRRHFADPAGLPAFRREGLFRFSGGVLKPALMEVAGFEAPVLQQALHDADGLVGYADYGSRRRLWANSMAWKNTSSPSS